ncbi:MAG: diacylglycerol kinase family protein [Candidatus Omnitrophica bacterium]|nr:diacylglycerol kinase family protein [Candidatus Omnitrophota bacterium]
MNRTITMPEINLGQGMDEVVKNNHSGPNPLTANASSLEVNNYPLNIFNKRRNLLSSFVCAWEGLKFALKSQRNIRIHIITGLSVIVLSLLIKVSYLEMAILFLAMIFVIACEIINTALELSLDFLNGKKYHPSVKLVKDIAAAGVLLASINAVIVGAIIFFKNIVTRIA